MRATKPEAHSPCTQVLFAISNEGTTIQSTNTLVSSLANLVCVPYPLAMFYRVKMKRLLSGDRTLTAMNVARNCVVTI